MFGTRLLRSALWTLPLLAIAGVAPAAPPEDPVYELRLALRTQVRVPGNPVELEFRQRNLARRVDALTNIGDLGQALLLQEWHIEDQDERVARINQAMRTQVLQKFDASARTILRSGRPRAKVAVARLIGELGVDVRGTGSNWGGAMRPLAPAVASLLNERDEAARLAAAEALGRINPEADVAVPALSRALTADTTPVRRAAAAAFATWIKRATHLSKNQSAGGVLFYRRNVLDSALGGFMGVGSDPLTGLSLLAGLTDVVGEGPGITEVVVTRDELQALAGAAIPILARGERDADSQVRRNSLEGLNQVAISLAEMVADPRTRTEFPPEGRAPSRDEERFITQYRYEVESERLELLPLAEALRKEASAFRRVLTDADPAIRLDACETMIEIGLVRVKLLRRAASVPPFDSTRLPADQDPILTLYKAVLPQLDEATIDPVSRVRLHAVEATEMLGPDVILGAPTLERALGDRDRFVRWAAIRALGRLTPEQGEKVVPALIPSLRDPDIDLRMMAAATLERYGAHAREALPELRRAVLIGDADMRKAAISAILGMGTEVAAPAIPTLIEAVADEQSPVRRAAAEALEPFGPAAKDAIPALTTLQDSDDADDRKAATYAILRILAPK